MLCVVKLEEIHEPPKYPIPWGRVMINMKKTERMLWKWITWSTFGNNRHTQKSWPMEWILILKRSTLSQ